MGFRKKKRCMAAFPVQTPNSTIRQGKQEVNCRALTQLTGSHVQFGRYFLAAPITNCHTTTTALFPQRCRPSLSLQCLATYSTEIPWLYSEASEINPPALSTEWTIGGTILMTPTCCLSVRSQILPKAASKHQHKHVPVLPHGTYTRIRNI
jgi:hypothetical protein